MAFDGLFLAAIREELGGLKNSKVDRIFQPEKETVVLHLRKGREVQKLLLSSLPHGPRVHLTRENFLNPPTPPLFCQVLRKHLEGISLLEVEQPELERVLVFIFGGYDGLGQKTVKKLVAEIMGKHSNIILLDSRGIIVDAARRYTHEVSRHREVLPGKPYVPPPPQDKEDPRLLTPEKWRALFQEGWRGEKWLVERLAGIGPQTAREILFRGGLHSLEVTEENIMASYGALQEILSSLYTHSWKPVVVWEGEKPLAFAAFDLKQFSGLKKEFFASPSQACEAFYRAQRLWQKKENLKAHLEGLLLKELQRCRKKEALHKETLEEGGRAEKYRLAGELILAHLPQLAKGMASASLTDLYHPQGRKVDIKLDPSLSPAENAQAYFRLYQKAKSAVAWAQKQLRAVEEEISYLESVQQSLDMAQTLEDLEEIREELQQSGYLPPEDKAVGRKERRMATSRPLEFISPDGFKILVGKNNRQNERLTFKIAAPEDLWLHVKDLPGSHVIIRSEGKEVPPSTLEMAAYLAAKYSRASLSSKAPVDYTKVKYVRKLPGGKPGMVLYEGHRTLYVDPTGTSASPPVYPGPQPLDQEQR